MGEKTTIRLTVRPPDGLEKTIREAAEEKGLTINQLMLSVLNQWAKSRRSHPHRP